MSKGDLITADELREVLAYDPSTGVFTWRIHQGFQSPSIGSVAGTDHSEGYRYICIRRRQYGAHRLAWLYMTGAWPAEDIDHANCDRKDNHFANLREATRAQNNRNARLSRNSQSGRKGVSWCRQMRKWRARIGIGGQTVILGYFDDIDEAAATYAIAARNHHGEFARTE